MASCAFNFGYDVGNFGGVQGMQSGFHLHLCLDNRKIKADSS